MKEPLETVTGAGHRLGEYIRDQRRGSQISLRQLAVLAGVSNPYLSQIERGLRKPSAEILQQIAKGLRISAEALYLQAGILEHREGDQLVVDAVLADEGLGERQKQVLLEVYESFRRENGPSERPATTYAPPAGRTPVDVPPPPVAEGATTAGRTAPDTGTKRPKAASRKAAGHDDAGQDDAGRATTPRTRARRTTPVVATAPAPETTPTPPQEASA